jgi:carbonic anhydrase/acetyltransferase-like protein (isoleucine patch superfamily)
VIESFAGTRPDSRRAAFVAPDAVVIGNVRLGVDTSIWYGCVLRGDVHWISIGDRTNIQDGSVVHVETGRCPAVIGADVTVGHRAILHGCTVEDRCLIGMGAILLNDAVVESGSVVAAGAVLREGMHVPAGSLVAGVPATIKRRLDDGVIEEILASARDYVELARTHAAIGVDES